MEILGIYRQIMILSVKIITAVAELQDNPISSDHRERLFGYG